MAHQWRVRVDSRELLFPSWAAYWQDHAPSLGVERSTLPVADLWLETRVGSEAPWALVAVVERKTVADYVASVRDGRLTDQTQRLQALCSVTETCSSPGPHVWLWIIRSSEPLDPMAAQQLATGTLHRQWHPHMRTLTLDGDDLVPPTVIKWWEGWRRLVEDGATLGWAPPVHAVEALRGQRKGATVADVLQQQWMCVPRVSPPVAAALVDEFPTWEAFVTALARVGTRQAAEKWLSGFSVPGQTRKLGPRMATWLVDVAWGAGVQVPASVPGPASAVPGPDQQDRGLALRVVANSQPAAKRRRTEVRRGPVDTQPLFV